MPLGVRPTGMVLITALFAEEMTETVLLSRLVTYTLPPPGVVATPYGALPTPIMPSGVLVDALRTSTCVPPSAAYTRVPSELTASPYGPALMGIDAITAPLVALMTNSAPVGE